MTDYYINAHWSQYHDGASAITRSSGCTWTSLANGVRAVTGGKRNPSPDDIKALVPRSKETNPDTPGWSLGDAAKAMLRLGVSFEPRSNRGWAAVKAAHDAGLYIVLQGDSDQFSDATCSGAFNGDHAIGVHPQENAAGRWRINDPICGKARYESEATLRKYAEKLNPKVYFGVFLPAVPTITIPDTSTEGDMPALHTVLTGWRGRVKVGSNVRTEPKIAATKLRTTTVEEVWHLIGTVQGDKDPATGSTIWYTRFHSGRWEYTAEENLTGVYDATRPQPDNTPFGPADIEAANKTGYTDGKTAGVASERERLRKLLGI